MSSPNKEINKDRLLQILYYLNNRLAENNLFLDLNVYKHTVMTLLYDIRPATKDIECVFIDCDMKILDNILDLTGTVFNLNNDWLFNQIKQPIIQLIHNGDNKNLTYSNLRVISPLTEQLLAMKILSARSFPSKDFEDAYLLCKDLRITTKQQVVDIFNSYIPSSYLLERQTQFIKYLGKDLGYDWQ